MKYKPPHSMALFVETTFKGGGGGGGGVVISLVPPLPGSATKS